MQTSVTVLCCHCGGVLEFLDCDFLLHLQVGQFIPQSLQLDPQVLALLFSHLDFLVLHYPALDGMVVLGFQVLQRRLNDPFLALKVIVGHLDVPQPQLQRPIFAS